jgi:hypothetical protein
MKSLIAVSATACLACSSHAQPVQTTDGEVDPGYVRLDDDARQLRDDFNRTKGTVRLLFVVDPSCSVCLRGMDDINRDLLSSTRDPRLQTFVVHVPVIGAQAKHVLPAAKLLPAENVRHYWNASGEFGRDLSKRIGLKNSKKFVYAWDVWLIYDPGVTWSEKAIPQPVLLMHQLEELDETKLPWLDSKSFAERVKRELSKLNQARSTNLQ